MRLDAPRVPPLEEDEWGDAVRELLGAPGARGAHLNVARTLAHHPDLLRRWRVFTNHVVFKSTLPRREREMLILRIGWLCRSEYEWAQHARLAREAGLSEEEIRSITAGPDAPGWSPEDAALLRAADELHEDAFICDETWQELARTHSTQQLMDIVFAVGQYAMTSMALNCLGVQIEPGVQGFPAVERADRSGTRASGGGTA